MAAAAILQTCSLPYQNHVMVLTLVLILNLQMAKGNVGSLLVFDPEKIDFASDDKVTSAAGDAVVGIVTERGQRCMPGFSTAMNKTCQALCLPQC